MLQIRFQLRLCARHPLRELTALAQPSSWTTSKGRKRKREERKRERRAKEKGWQEKKRRGRGKG